MKITNPVSVWEFIRKEYFEKDAQDFWNSLIMAEGNLDLVFLDIYYEIKNTKILSHYQAEKLSLVTKYSKEFWLNLDKNYRENMEDMIGKRLNTNELEVGRFYDYLFSDQTGKDWLSVQLLWIGKQYLVVATESGEEYVAKTSNNRLFRISEKYFEGGE